MNNKEIKNLENLTKKERKVIRIKDLIINSAKELFSENTFEMITMEDIAEATALSRATLYNYFNTKEEIYFSIGIAQLKQWINQYNSLPSKKYSGADLVMILTENLVRDLKEFPFYSKLLRRFFYRSKELDLKIEHFFYDSISEVFFYDNKLERNDINNKFKEVPQHQIFIDLLESYTDFRKLMQIAINNGIKDGSIKSNSNPSHLNFIIIMLIFGFLDQIDFRRTLMEMVDISNEQITDFILNLVKKMLKGEV